MFTTAHNNGTRGGAPPSLADIIREETGDGRLIVRFLVAAMQGEIEDARIYHRLDVARQLVKYGDQDAQAFIYENRNPFPQSLGTTRRPSSTRSGPILDLAEIIRHQTGDGRIAVRFLVDVMEGRLRQFKPHHRIVAARELLHHGFGDTRDDDDDDDDGYDDEPSGREPGGPRPSYVKPATRDYRDQYLALMKSRVDDDDDDDDDDEDEDEEPDYSGRSGRSPASRPGPAPNLPSAGAGPPDRNGAPAPTPPGTEDCGCPYHCDCPHLNDCLFEIDEETARLTGCECHHDCDCPYAACPNKDQQSGQPDDGIPHVDDLPPPPGDLFEPGPDPTGLSHWELKAMRKGQEIYWDSPGRYGSTGRMDSLSP